MTNRTKTDLNSITGSERRQHPRRDAACPATARLWLVAPSRDFVVRGRLVNISESGCMIGANEFPWTEDALGQARGEERRFPDLTDHIIVHLPWTDTTLKGYVRRRGPFSLHVEFAGHLPSRVVDRIASMDRPDEMQPQTLPPSAEDALSVAD